MMVDAEGSPTEAEIQPMRPSWVSTTYQISAPVFLPMTTTVSSSSKYPPTSKSVPGPRRKLAELTEIRYSGNGVGKTLVAAGEAMEGGVVVGAVDGSGSLVDVLTTVGMTVLVTWGPRFTLAVVRLVGDGSASVIVGDRVLSGLVSVCAAVGVAVVTIAPAGTKDGLSLTMTAGS
jgi:hypothetical protein